MWPKNLWNTLIECQKLSQGRMWSRSHAGRRRGALETRGHLLRAMNHIRPGWCWSRFGHSLLPSPARHHAVPTLSVCVSACISLPIHSFSFIPSPVFLTDLYPTSPPLAIAIAHSVPQLSSSSAHPNPTHTHTHYILQTQYTLAQLCSSWSLEITFLLCAKR